MKKQFVPPEESYILKELGFDEPCFGVYINEKFQPRYKSVNSKFSPNSKLSKRNVRYCTAPTWDQAFDFFICNYGLTPIIETNGYSYIFKIQEVTQGYIYIIKDFTTYEEARLECLKKLIELVKTK